MQLAKRRRAVGWWPEGALDAPLDEGTHQLAAEYVFPSGRAAIAQCLDALDLPTHATIAMEPHRSECLTRIVRRFGTPVDICEANGSAAAAVVYEQWGWPVTDAAWDEITERFKSRPIVLDRVDSADFFSEGHRAHGTVEVVSLSKLLGLAGGGLARANGCFVAFEPEQESAALRQLARRPMDGLKRAGYKELFKEGRQAVHPAAMAWLQHNCVARAAEEERAARQHQLQLMLNSSLSNNWPAWMEAAIDAGAGPVWVPILREREAAEHWRAMATLDQRYDVVSAPRLFNWSGNPLRPQYELCLALPVHSGVADFGEIVAALV